MSAWFSEKLRNLNFGQSLSSLGKSVLLTSLIVTGAVVGLRQLGALEGLELGAYDQLIRLRPDEEPDDRLLVVGVSETDIQTRNEYPLHDGTLAQLLEKLETYQPRAIGIDILRDVPQGEGRAAMISRLEGSDRIITVCQLSSTDQPGIAPAPGIPDEQVGFANIPVDPGGILRRVLLLSVPQESALPVPSQHVCNDANPDNQLLSFGFNLALLYLFDEGIEPELLPSGDMQIGSTVFKRLAPKAGGYHRADAGDYQMMINYRSAKNAVEQVTLTDVLQDRVDPSLIEERIVLVGYTASIVKDDFYTPYSAGAVDSQKMPGVVIHAQNTSQILSAVLDNRPLIWYWSEGVEILWIFAWSLIGATLAWRTRRLWVFGASIVVAGVVLYIICYVAFLGSGWIPLVPAAIALVATTLSFFFVKHAKAIYQGVKKIILNIEIDEEKKQQQVAAITESDTFAELQARAQELRQSRRRSRRERPLVTIVETQETESSEDGDYLQNLQQKGRNLRSRNHSPAVSEVEPIAPPVRQSVEVTEEIDFFDRFRNKPPSPEPTPPPVSQSPTPPTTPEDTDYLQTLQKRGRRLRTSQERSPNPSNVSLITDTEEETDYLQHLQKRGKQLKNAQDKA